MKPRILISSIPAGPGQAIAFALALLSLVTGSQAATITKAGTGTDLTAGASWTGSTAPGSGDVASWAITSLGASLTLAGSASWSGINVVSAASAIGVTGAGPLTLGSGGINMPFSTVNLTLGTPVVLGANQTWIVNSGMTLAASGIISGTGMGISKAGAGQVTLSGANTYDGTTTILGGTLVADTATNATVLNSASGLTFTGSGTFQLKGLSAQTRSQIVNGLTLTKGAATIDANNTGTSTTIDLRGTVGTLTIARSAGATVDFKASAGTFGTTAIVNTAQANGVGILGAWATVNTGADWAINNGSGVAAAYTGYNTLSGTSLTTGVLVNVRVATNPTTPTGNITMGASGTIDINTLRISDSAARTIDVENAGVQGTLRFGAVGGLLTSGGSHVIGVSGVSTAGTITAGGATASNPGELVVNNASGLIINSVITNNGTGAVTLTKSGAGTLTLNGASSTYSGGTFINSGTVSLATQVNTSIGTGPITVNSGGTLNLTRNQINRDLTMNGGTLQGGGGWGDVTWAGTVTLAANSTFNFTDYPSVINAPVSGTGGLTKTGAGILKLNNASNSYSGPTVVGANSILEFRYSLYGNDTSKWIPANITVANNAGLAINVGGTSEFTPSQAGTLWTNLTTVQSNGLQNGSTVCFDTSNAGATVQTISATLTDSTGPGGGVVGLRHFGGGTLELTGANTFSGVVGTDMSGTLKVSSINSVATNATTGTVHSASSNLGAPTTVANGTIWLGHGPLTSNYNGANLLYTGTGETTDRVICLGGANGTTYILDQSGSGLLKFTSAFTTPDNRGPKTITLQGSTTGTGEIASIIPIGQLTSPNILTKTGTGTWTLSNANVYAGVTTVSGGCLVLKDPGALPGGIGTTGGISALTFNGGVIGLGTTGDFTRSLAAAGTVTGVCFTGNGGWAAYGANRAVNLGGALATVAWGTASTGLNAKTLILGNTTATHTLDFQNPLDMGSAARTVQVDKGAAAIDGKLSGNITGIAGGNLTKTGAGTLALTGTNNYVGTTTVNAGTLLVNGTNSGTGLVTVTSGATLGGTGAITAAATFSPSAKAVFTVNRDPVTQANTTPLTITGVMTYNTTEVHLNLPAGLPSGTYTLATSSATPAGTVTATPVVDSGSYAAGFTSAVVSLDTVSNKLLLTVNGLPTTPTTLAITSINGGINPTAGLPFNVVVKSMDTNGLVRNVIQDTVVSLTQTAGTPYSLAGNLVGTITAGTSTVTISGVLYSTPESGVVLTATVGSGDTLSPAASAAFTVIPDTTPTSLTVSGFPASQTAGLAGNLTVTAMTPSGAVATSYVGTVHFTSNDSQAVLPANYTFVPSDFGIHTFPGGVTLKTAGTTQSITGTDTVTSSITGTESAITVVPAAPATLIVSGFPSPHAQSVAASVTVSLKDAYNNSATNYTGTIHFTSSDVSATLPGDYAFVSGDQGVHTFTNGVTLVTLGTNESITATDAVYSVTGTQSGITVWVPPTSFTWANAADGNWSVPTNWQQYESVSFAPITTGEADYTLNFGAGTYTATNNLSDGFLVNKLNFSGAVTLGGSDAIALAANGATLPTINQTLTGTVWVSSPLTLGADTTVSAGTGGMNLVKPISGPGNLIVAGPGPLTLSGTNSYGTTTVNSNCTLNLSGGTYGTGPVTVHSGATIEAGGNGNITNTILVDTAKVNNGNGFSGNFNGPVTLSGSCSFDLGGSGNMAINGIIDGTGGLTKLGTSGGPLNLNAANTYSGATTINVGTIKLGAAGLLINTSGISIAAGTTFDVSAKTSPYVWGASTSVIGKGTGTIVGTNAARILTATSGVVSLGSVPINLTFAPAVISGDVNHPALLIVPGALTLDNNAFTITNAGPTLGAGVYRLIQVGDGSTGVISESATPSYAVTVGGNGMVAGCTAKVSVSSGNVILSVLSDPYAVWVTNYFPTPGDPNAAKTADPDNDGQNNLTEFALYSNPTSGASPGTLRTRLETIGVDTALVFTLPVRSGAIFSGSPSLSATIDGVVYTIEGTNDLATFDQGVTEITPALSAGMPTLSDPGWSYRSFRLSGAIGGTTPRGPEGFLRACVTAAP